MESAKDYVKKLQSPDGKGTHFLYVEDDVVHTKSVGYFDTELTTKVVDGLSKIRKEIGKNYPLLVDVSEQTGLSAESRKLLGEKLLLSDELLSRLAVVGGNFLIRSLFNMYSLVSRVPLKAFASREEALPWIKEGSS